MEKLKWIVIVTLIVVVLNLGLLYWIYYQLKQEVETNTRRSQAQTQVDTADEPKVVTVSALGSCPTNCTDQINQLKKVVTAITPGVIREVVQVITQPVAASLVSSTSTGIKEYYIDFGSGSVDSTDWVDVPGLSKYINSNNYGDISSVIFEASIRIPTGNGKVSARIYNMTDKTAILSSEVSSEGSTSILKQSSAIPLAVGNKLYQVQMKNTMEFDTRVDSARFKINLK